MKRPLPLAVASLLLCQSVALAEGNCPGGVCLDGATPRFDKVASSATATPYPSPSSSTGATPEPTPTGQPSSSNGGGGGGGLAALAGLAPLAGLLGKGRTAERIRREEQKDDDDRRRTSFDPHSPTGFLLPPRRIVPEVDTDTLR